MLNTLYVYIYIYMYTHVSLSLYIYIYIYICFARCLVVLAPLVVDRDVDRLCPALLRRVRS